MPEPLLYLKAMGAASVVSAIIVLIAASRRPASPTWLNAACVLGLGLGLALGFYVISLSVACPPRNALDRFLVIVVPAALVIELLSGYVRQWTAWLLRLSLAGAIPRILLHGSIYLSDSAANALWQTGLLLIAGGGLLATVWVLCSWAFQRSDGVSIPLVLGLSTHSAGLTVMMAGYIKGGAAAFPLSSAIAATAFGAWLMMKRSGATSKTPPAAILGIGVVGLFSLLFIGRFFGRLSTAAALTLLLAPLLCLVTEAPLLRRRRPWIVGSIRIVLVSIPLLIVLALAKRDFDREMRPLLYAPLESSPRSDLFGAVSPPPS